MNPKIENPKIPLLLSTLGNLLAFAREAAASAAQDPALPFGASLTNIPETDKLFAAYKDDEQIDRGALFKGALAEIEIVVAELKALDVLVAPEAP